MQKETAVFFNKMAEGKLWLQYCDACQKFIFYPRSLCPDCFKAGLQWRATKGIGEVYSFTIINYSSLPEKKEKVPYVYAIVELEEGIRLASNIIDCRPENVFIGMQVELVVNEYHNLYLHYFRPAAGALNGSRF